jgi:hypothetical protein
MLIQLFFYASLEQPRQFGLRLFLNHLQAQRICLCYVPFVF